MVSINQKSSILIVDDIPANIRVLFEILQQSCFRVSVAKTGESALEKVQEALPDLILLDVMMPGIDGFETCRRLKANPVTQEIPIIFLSALDEVVDKVKGFAIGGVDYITKPFHTEEILARVKNQLALQAAKAEILQLNVELEQRVRQRTAQLEAANQELQREITERKKAENQLVYGALHDALTDLPNRTLLTERLELALKRAEQYADYLFAVLFIDLDRFKVVNDSLGHQVGDRLLVAIANQLKTIVRSTDTVARLGGDEFVILLDPIKDISDATEIAERVSIALKLPFQLEGIEVFTTASIGITLSSTNYKSASELLRDADIAMYCSKAKGKACYEVFEPVMYTQATKRLQLESELHQALEQQQFQVYYQPIISLLTGRMRGFEALIRWQHPIEGLVSPAEFIPLAEETGLIVPIGEWVLRAACYQMSVWQTKYSTAIPLEISVNLSVKQLKTPDFLEKLDQILAQTGLESQRLKLELTESIFMENDEEFNRILSLLRSRSIQLSVDDFGTGYSSLSYLHRFPVNNLKIDRSFVSRIGEKGENREIIETIVTLAHQLGMEVTAEGVETKHQLNQLKSLACETFQGYFFSKPLEREAAESLIAANINSCQESVLANLTNTVI